MTTQDQAVQIDIFGGEHTLAPAPAPTSPETFEQPRLFEPQYEGQLVMSGTDQNPESGAEAPRK